MTICYSVIENEINTHFHVQIATHMFICAHDEITVHMKSQIQNINGNIYIKLLIQNMT